MVRKFILPLLAAALLLFAVFHVVRAQQDRPKAAPPYAPAQTPFAQTPSTQSKKSTHAVPIGA